MELRIKLLQSFMSPDDFSSIISAIKTQVAFLNWNDPQNCNAFPITACIGALASSSSSQRNYADDIRLLLDNINTTFKEEDVSQLKSAGKLDYYRKNITHQNSEGYLEAQVLGLLELFKLAKNRNRNGFIISNHIDSLILTEGRVLRNAQAHDNDHFDEGKLIDFYLAIKENYKVKGKAPAFDSRGPKSR